MPQIYSFKGAFDTRDDLRVYGDNALLLFALQMKMGIDDIEATATDSITDGADDKKCDLVFVDSDRRIAIVAQGYVSKSERSAAPADKAADLNIAASWLLSMDMARLPERLKPSATALRNGLSSHEIETLEFWYVHNCPESQNVGNELSSVELAAKSALTTYYPESGCNDIRALEVGLNTLEEWYSSIKAPILVSDHFEIGIPGGYETHSEQWRAFSTAVPANWVYEVYQRYSKKLFSANLRDYLGSRKSDSNINHGIKETASNNPQNFWVFNNGITALVNRFEVSPNHEKIAIDGISIVNGAQTTGAVASLEKPPESSALIPARFIECSNTDIIQDIVRYNNSQNKVAPADFRSTDGVQERLRKEFQRYPNIIYLGGRRGGTDDIIRRRPGHNYIPSDTVAQALTAFHHNPVLAYNLKSEIWGSDHNYSQVFNEGTHAAHLVFVYSLLRTVNNLKLEISSNKSELTDVDSRMLAFLRFRGATYVFISAMGKCLEIIVGKPISNKFLLRFHRMSQLPHAEEHWIPIVRACIPFCESLQAPLEKGLKNIDETNKAIENFRMFIHSASSIHQTTFASFARVVDLSPWPPPRSGENGTIPSTTDKT